MSSRWTGFFVWALVAATVAFWGLRIFAATRPVPPGAQAPVRAVAAAGPMVRLFGAVAEADADAPEAAASDRFKLLGVIAAPAGPQAGPGFAVISIDGQPARSVTVGKAVEGDTVLLAVGKRSADLGPRSGPAAFTLELPAPGAAATGTLPAPGAPGAAVARAPVPGQPVGYGGRMPLPGGPGAMVNARAPMPPPAPLQSGVQGNAPGDAGANAKDDE